MKTLEIAVGAAEGASRSSPEGDREPTTMSLGVVVIGRNEGERLQRCLQSVLGQGAVVIYVDSGSADGSVSLARSLGAEVVELDGSEPFSAARARNADSSACDALTLAARSFSSSTAIAKSSRVGSNVRSPRWPRNPTRRSSAAGGVSASRAFDLQPARGPGVGHAPRHRRFLRVATP